MQTNPQALQRVLLDTIRDAVVTTDTHARITSWNAAAVTMTGWAESEVLGLPVDQIVSLRDYGTDSPRPNPACCALFENKKVNSRAHCLLIGKDGRRIGVHLSATPLHNAKEKLTGCLLIFYDASEALRMAERISYLAQHDPLTGLPNRILFVDRLEQATRLADRTKELIAVAFLDLDNFHQLNEQFGNAAADRFLKEIAYRLTGTLRETDTVCRLGGDEFVLLLPDVRSVASVELLAGKLLEQVAPPCILDGATLQATASMGVSVYPFDANDGESLMQLADAAMHKAKQQGRNRFVLARAKADRNHSLADNVAPFNSPFH